MNTIHFGKGAALLDDATGAPLSFTHPDSPQRQYLLDDALFWQTCEHHWGVGAVVTDHGAARWNTPTSRTTADESSERLTYDLTQAGLTLEVTRSGGERLSERFEWRNTSDSVVDIESLGIQTPFNDWYPGGMRALTECVNTHIFTGDAWSWVLAEPMSGISGNDPALGLIVREGSLCAYSIESRTQVTSSNTRGHIVLRVTDHALNPDAFGGQPIITLQPGESYILRWELGWYTDRESFIADTHPMATLRDYAATLGDTINVATDQPLRCITAALPAYAPGRTRAGGILEEPTNDDLHIEKVDGGYRVTAARPGIYTLGVGEDGHTGRVEVLFHNTVKETVQHVCGYVLSHHVAVDRPGLLAAGIVPVDTRTGLRVDDGGWSDWTDGSERISMAILLQKAINRGWIGTEDMLPQAQAAVDAWREFAMEYLIDGEYRTRRGSSQGVETFGERIYDMPWITEFFCDHYEATGSPADLDVAFDLLMSMASLGGEHFLAISFGEVSSRVARYLRAVGRDAEADAVESHVVASADYFLGIGKDLPDHEVAYEQSITAPLVNLYIEAHRITGDARYLAATAETLRWLLAFGGPQPSVRLNGIGLRHWDGYWFGICRQFGDVFPHYWTALTATALARLPRELRTDETGALALRIMRANMTNYNPDGSGTCAFMYPSSIDGQPEHRADAMANDQNWHLSIWLRLMADESFPEV